MVPACYTKELRMTREKLMEQVKLELLTRRLVKLLKLMQDETNPKVKAAIREDFLFLEEKFNKKSYELETQYSKEYVY
jgi:hypothetical protein